MKKHLKLFEEFINDNVKPQVLPDIKPDVKPETKPSVTPFRPGKKDPKTNPKPKALINTNEAEDTTNAMQVELINATNLSKAKTALSAAKIPFTTVVINASTFIKFKSIPDFKKGSKVIYSTIDKKLEASTVAPK